MPSLDTRGVAALIVALLATMPNIAATQNLERSRFIATSDVLSRISMFTFQERRKSDLIFRATPILSEGEGKAEVEYQDGNASIVAEVKDMPPPAELGPYTTYVLWALTPDGRASNEGVLTGPEGGRDILYTQYSASQFTLIVTAEPHFAVSAPSNVVVLYNVPDKVRGIETKISSLFERADYTALAPLAPEGRPVELVQAEYSLAIARAAGAEDYAANALSAAAAKLTAANTAWGSSRSRDRKMVPDLAREAVVAGEDARRAALAERVEVDARAERERAVQAAAEAAAAAERDRAEAERLRREADREREAAAAAEAARLAKAEADALAAAAAQAAAREADARARAEARASLLNRLSSVLPTRETERGLVSEIGGVQFATGTANLNGGARETLARFSGIVASYPELEFRIEGHTDNVGSDATNAELSLRRALTVRDYLVRLGVPMTSIDVDGYGPTRPVASNETVEGRARNRRVEIVISGGLLVAGNR
jgi:outer membrane protein OmpA-like peptidoglycan-associated protein